MKLLIRKFSAPGIETLDLDEIYENYYEEVDKIIINYFNDNEKKISENLETIACSNK